MSDEIVFYTNPMSRGRIVRFMLEELGAPYRVEPLRFDRGEHKRPEYLALNPMGKVPTIVHRGVVVTEAAAICTYLADAFPAAELAPALDDPARGTYLRWLFFGAGCVEPALADKALGREAPERRSTVGYGTYEDTLNALEKAVTPGPFILGERFSAADVYVGSEVLWGLAAKTLEPRPPLVEYAKRISARPAYERAGARDDELAKELAARS